MYQYNNEGSYKINGSDPDIPYVTNVTAEVVKSGEAIKELLVRQVSSSVRWEQSMRAMIAQGKMCIRDRLFSSTFLHLPGRGIS